MKNIFLPILLTLSLVSCSMMEEGKQETIDKIKVGDVLPAFAITMHDGTVVHSGDLRGKPALIVLFNTTCGDCQRELPGLNARYLKHGADTTFVAISRAQADAEVADYWEREGLSIPFSAQEDRRVYELFASVGIPRIYITDANGVVREVHAEW